jgi:hypothetical protein
MDDDKKWGSVNTERRSIINNITKEMVRPVRNNKPTSWTKMKFRILMPTDAEIIISIIIGAAIVVGLIIMVVMMVWA